MISLSSGLKNSLLDTLGLRALIGGGAIHLFDGTQPTHSDRETNSARLGVITKDGAEETLPTNGLYFELPVNGILMKKMSHTWTIRLITPGTATWFRLVSWRNEWSGYSTNAIRIDGTIGEDLILVDPVLVAGVQPDINSFYIHL